MGKDILLLVAVELMTVMMIAMIMIGWRKAAIAVVLNRYIQSGDGVLNPIRIKGLINLEEHQQIKWGFSGIKSLCSHRQVHQALRPSFICAGIHKSLNLYTNKVIYHTASCSIDNWLIRILQPISETVREAVTVGSINILKNCPRSVCELKIRKEKSRRSGNNRKWAQTGLSPGNSSQIQVIKGFLSFQAV